MMLKVFTLAAVGVVFFASEHAAAAAAGAPELVSFKCDKTEVDVSNGDATVTCKLCANDGSGFYSDSDDMDDTYYSELLLGNLDSSLQGTSWVGTCCLCHVR